MKTKTLILGMVLTFPIATLAQTTSSTNIELTAKIPRADLLVKRDPKVQATRSSNSRLGGDGTRGGGETVDLSGRPELRDLVETSVCDWQTGDDILKVTPYTHQILKNIERLDWYFAMTLESEIRSLDFCITGPLVRVQTEDDDSLTAVVTEGASQVAIRLFDSVYIDTTIYDRMSERSKGYLLIHEVMHSFLGHPESRRNHKLRSMVKTIEGLETGRNATRRQFQLQMSRNSIVFPLSVDQLGRDRKALEFALSSFEDKLAMLSAERNPELLFEAVKAVDLGLVWEPHHEILATATPIILTETALFLDDPRMLQVITKSSKLAKSVLAQAYIMANAEEHPQISEWLATQLDLTRLVDITLKDLAERKAIVIDGAIFIPGQELIAASGDQTVPAASLRALQSTTGDEISSEVSSYLQLLESFLAKGDLTSARSLTVASEVFYQAFGINQINQQIANLSDVSALEREISKRNVRIMAVAFWNHAENQLFKGTSLKNWKLIKKDINFIQLGYKF